MCVCVIFVCVCMYGWVYVCGWCDVFLCVSVCVCMHACVCDMHVLYSSRVARCITGLPPPPPSPPPLQPRRLYHVSCRFVWGPSIISTATSRPKSVLGTRHSLGQLNHFSFYSILCWFYLTTKKKKRNTGQVYESVDS